MTPLRLFWLTFLLGLCTISFSDDNPKRILCVENERLALLQFKSDLIDGANRLSSWNNAKIDCCRWAGVVCDKFTGHVQELHLRGPNNCNLEEVSDKMLGGNINASLLSLKQLKYLDLSCNNFNEIQIPSFIGSLGNLRYLNLSMSQFQGGVLHQLGNLSKLVVLDIGMGPWLSSVPVKNLRWLSSLTLLQYLDMSGYDLSGAFDWLQVINTLPSLEELHLPSCAIPDCWMNWQALSVINFENNNLIGGIPQSVGNLTSLRSFNIRNNKLSGNLPAFLFNSKSLQIIMLAENEFAGGIPLLIEGEDSKLKLLSLRSNKLEGEIPVELCRLTSIQILDLAHNNLSGTLPTCFYNFSIMSGRQQSSEIVLYDVPFQVQVIGSASLVSKGREFQYSTILYLVTTLDLSGNRFSGPVPKELMGLLGLRWLNLSGNHLTGRIPEEIGKMTLLESLDLSVNQIDGRIPWSMSRLTTLNWLNLSINQLTGEIPTSTQLQSFSESSFMGNSLCGPPLAVLCNRKGVAPDASTRGEVEVNDDESDGKNWGLIISIVLGFIIGFWAVVAPLIASKAWRQSFFYFLQKVCLKICNACHIN